MDYIVQPGDTLWRIAARHFGSGVSWQAIADDNHLHRGERLLVGQRLWLRDSLLRTGTASLAARESTSEPQHGFEGASSVVEGRAFFFVLADEVDPLRGKVVRKVMVNPAIAAQVAKQLGRAVRLQPNPEYFGLHPTTPLSNMSPGRHVTGLKPSPFSSASTHPLGPGRMSGSRFWIDVTKARQAGAEFITTDEIVADLDRIMRKTRNPVGIRALDEFKVLARADAEVLVKGSVPASAIKGAPSMALTRGLQGVQLVGFVMTAIDVSTAAQRSIEQKSVKPVVAEGLRQAGGWSMAWAGLKLGAAAGALFGIETGPGAVITAGFGGFVGGVGGYFGFDWIADQVSPN